MKKEKEKTKEATSKKEEKEKTEKKEKAKEATSKKKEKIAKAEAGNNFCFPKVFKQERESSLGGVGAED